ncbi:xanthine dehydrogenase family protein molybdopterin-binding subunit [Stappia taiwanensis]|nr:xanthine dehydrogenase family protein molybdopterin-binding subunit [Stappia taiwanensis]
MDANGQIDKAGKSWMGEALRRREDRRLVTGQGRYVDDLTPEGCLHLEFVRSQFAHGEIVELDLEEARALDGVVAVFTAADLAGLGAAAINLLIPDVRPQPMHVLAAERVEAVGQPVAAIVATSRAIARDAAQLAGLDIEPLSVASGEDRPEVLTPEVLSHDWRSGDADAAFAAADHVVGVTVEHSLLAPMALEPRAALADWREGRLTAWLSTQTPHRARDDLARMLALPLAQVRVIAPDVGGAFGGKASIYPEDVMVAFAARRLGAPVKWCATRSDDLLAATHGRGATTSGELAVAADGTVLGLRAKLAFQLGSWMPFSAVIPARNAGRILPGPYRVEDIDIGAKGYFANRAAVGIYRGAGRPEATMLMERLMDEAARVLSLDPLEFRRRNLIAADAFPYATPTGETLDSGNYQALVDMARHHAGYDALRARQAELRRDGKIFGIGVSLYIEPCGQGWESATASLCRDGTIIAATGSSAQGQGRETAFSQIVADLMRVSPERVTVRHGDTGESPTGIGALASRSTAIGGGAMVRACEGLLEQIRRAGAELLQCGEDEIVPGDAGVSVASDQGRMATWEALAGHLLGPETGDPKEAALCSSVVFHADGEAWASGCCIASVIIDEDTGTPTIDEVVWVDDAGVVLNPMLVRGQLVGGMAQGLGEALMERIVYDEDGQMLTGSLMDYAVPRAADIPPVRIEKIETPSPTNPLGAKGVGEAGCIGIPAAIVNAVGDALSPFGVRGLQMPLTSERIWRAMHDAAGRRSNVDQ